MPFVVSGLGVMKKFFHLLIAILAATIFTSCSTTPPASRNPTTIVQPNRKARICISKGTTSQSVGDLNGALQWYTKAIEADPSNSCCYQYRAHVYARLEQCEPCLNDCNRMVELSPNCGLFYLVRGGFLLKCGKVCDGMVDYANGSILYPQASHIFNHITQISVYKRIADLKPADCDTAISNLTVLIQANPSTGISYSFRGLAELAKADYAPAVADFNAAQERDEALIVPLYFRAQVFDRVGQVKDAISGYSEFVTNVAREQEYNREKNTVQAVGNFFDSFVVSGVVGALTLHPTGKPLKLFLLPALKDLNDEAEKRVQELSALSH